MLQREIDYIYNTPDVQALKQRYGMPSRDFTKAFHESLALAERKQPNKPYWELIGLVVQLLESALQDAAKTEGTTRFGKAWRWLVRSKVVSAVLGSWK